MKSFAKEEAEIIGPPTPHAALGEIKPESPPPWEAVLILENDSIEHTWMA